MSTGGWSWRQFIGGVMVLGALHLGFVRGMVLIVGLLLLIEAHDIERQQ